MNITREDVNNWLKENEDQTYDEFVQEYIETCNLLSNYSKRVDKLLEENKKLREKQKKSTMTKKEYNKKYYQRNKEILKEKQRLYYKEHKEKHNFYNKTHREHYKEIRRKRVEELRAKGCKNAWAVVSQAKEPKYE